MSYPVEIAEFVEVDYVVSGHQTGMKAVTQGSSLAYPITPAEGWAVDSILLNGEDILEAYVDGVLTTPALTGNSVIAVDMKYDADAYIPTGIDDVFSELDLRVWSEQGEIYVAGLKAGQTVDLYSMNGARMFTENVTVDGEARISVPASQVYILIVKEGERRVAVKINNK